MLPKSISLFALGLCFVIAASAQTQYAEPAITGNHNNSVAFGSAVAIDGNQILVGRSGLSPLFPEPPNQAGSVVVFSKTGGIWSPSYGLPAEGLGLTDGYGAEISLDGDVLAVAAPSAGDGCGRIYLYSRGASSWESAGSVAAADCSGREHLGQSLLVKGDRVYAGAPGSNNGYGSVVVFQRRNGTWSQTTELASSDSSSGFGASLAMTSKGLYVGEPNGPDGGRVQFFRMDATGSFAEPMVISAPDSTVSVFGAALAVHGPHVGIGAPGISLTGNNGKPNAGAVVVIEEADPGMMPKVVATVRMDESVVEMVPNVGPSNFGFGSSLDVVGNEFWVGGILDGQGRGAVRIFDIPSKPKQMIDDPELAVFSTFGEKLAVDGDLAAVVATRANFGDGKVYVYERNRDGGYWERAAVLLDQSRTLEASTGEDVTCEDGQAHGFGCTDVDLVSFLPVTKVGAEPGDIVNDLWGWTDEATGREYVLIGHSFSTSFVDISDPSNPMLLGTLPAHEGSVPNVWRDVKVYKNHAYIVADGAGDHGMQVFDLTQLRDVKNAPATFKETAHYDRIHSAHNIVINEKTGFAFAVGSSMGGETCGGGLHMIDIREPANPTFAGCFNDQSTQVSGRGYSHDAQCVIYSGPDDAYAGHEICFGSNETALSIADVTDKDNPVAIATVAYPDVSYAHQGWVTDDQRYFYMNDEGDELAGTTDGTRTLIWDIEDLDDPVYAGSYTGETKASDHNLYVKGNLMYESNYVSGLRIIDISNPTAPEEVGHFDTFPWGENGPGYAGSWSNYPYFSSGVIAVSSMKEGLFLVRYSRKAMP